MGIFRIHIERVLQSSEVREQTEARLAGWVGPFKVSTGPSSSAGGGWYRGRRDGARLLVRRDIPLGEYLVTRMGKQISSHLEVLADGRVRLVTWLGAMAVVRCLLGSLSGAAGVLLKFGVTPASWGVVAVIALGVTWFFYSGGQRVHQESDALTTALEHLIQ
ncbi:hypothetical protein SAMN05443572_1011036 [Myxococcus fulvus]|uniref:Uncharacterized protein n=1 Tax=Myxococcus fulvus TaxID=33 RepID=A0A511SW72_MYXFU|nr:hypothetical protein [Myxococcus fulvus]GEN05418.1 hypothetical protein MFU01_04550 [Myxococcus fulvus]SET07710.1 hypothetical protein SAMN05443572_1011036 [Myxococcus fulvus]